MARTSRRKDSPEYDIPIPYMEIRMRSIVCTLILATTSLAPLALLAHPPVPLTAVPRSSSPRPARASSSG